MFNHIDTHATEALSLHDALPILTLREPHLREHAGGGQQRTCRDSAQAADERDERDEPQQVLRREQDRKSTRLNSSHMSISYAVFCLKKKINNKEDIHT